MPFPLAAVIAAGAQLAGFGMSAAQTGNLNRKNRRFAEKQYKQQRQDAIDFWNMQNAYNTPEAQMSRFQQAGLNKNLMYGQGTEAGSINVPSQAHYEGKPADFSGVSRAPSAYFDARVKAMTVNNLGAQNDLIRAQTNKADAERIATLVNAASGNFDLGLKKEARQSLLDALNLKGDTAFLNWSRLGTQQENEVVKGMLLKQSYNYLKELQPAQLDRLKEGISLLRQQGSLNEASLTKMLKENRLIGVSDKTEIGSLVRALLTLFGQDSQIFNIKRK